MKNLETIDNIKNEEDYSFTWVGKKDSIKEAEKSTDKVMILCEEESKDYNTTGNLYIEGDNLDALKLLQENYLNKIKMIYIDPPYNTGKKFIYKDNFFSEENKIQNKITNREQSHCNWCSMMYPRLKLAKNLLTNNGVIFISIDDNELANLRKICDEVFGEENFITYLHLELSLTQGLKVGPAQNGSIVKNGEFIIVYAKNKNSFKVSNILYDGIDGYDTHFSVYLEEKDNILKMLSIGEFLKKDNKDINIIFDKNKMEHTFLSFCKLMNRDESFKELIYKKYSHNIFRSMMADIKIPLDIQDRLLKGEIVKYNKYILYKTESGNIRQLSALSSAIGKTDDYKPSYGRRRIRGNMWKGFYADMMNVAKEGNIEFKNGKKPVRLIKQLLKWGLNKNDIVLDFFSGSATTAHATIELNNEDGGDRKFIMVQLPEVILENSESFKKGFKNICELGKERIRRAGEQIKNNAGLNGLNLDIGFKVYKIK